MKVLWSVLKVALVLALVIPVSIIVLGTALSIFGALLGLAILVLKVAVAGVVVWGLFRLLRALFGRSTKPEASRVQQLPAVDPYYAAAQRELDRELGWRG